MATPCEACAGALTTDAEAVRSSGETLCVPVLCRQCGQRQEIAFAIGEGAETAAGCVWPALDTVRVINASDEPSRIIDVCGWLTLHSMIIEQARSLDDRAVVRRVQIVAGLCLDEALKFYDEDNDVPPAEAFFREASCRQFRDRPELFALQRLIDQRGALPVSSTGAMREGDSQTKNRKHWWLRRKQ